LSERDGSCWRAAHEMKEFGEKKKNKKNEKIGLIQESM
jgi:hypothetical protein